MGEKKVSSKGKKKHTKNKPLVGPTKSWQWAKHSQQAANLHSVVWLCWGGPMGDGKEDPHFPHQVAKDQGTHKWIM